MTDDAEARKGGWESALLALAILTLFTSMVGTAFAFRGYPDIYRDLGMTELPWITSMGIRFIEFFRQYWFVIAPFFVIGAVFAALGFCGRPNWIVLAIAFLISVTLPGIFYFALHSPVVELQRKLGSG